MSTDKPRSVDTFIFKSELDHGRAFVRAEEYDRVYDRFRAIEVAARDLDNLAPVDPNDARRWSPDAVSALADLRAAVERHGYLPGEPVR